MIYLRDDDVFWTGKEPPDERFEVFQRFHELLKINPKLFMHRPAIVAGSFSYRPAIDYIRDETAAGRMEPGIHGWEHIDYAKLDCLEIRQHLNRARDWIADNLAWEPTRFYSPWGADTPTIRGACRDLGFEFVGAVGAIKPRHAVHALAREYPWDHLYGKEILFHWHKPQDRVDAKRIVAIYAHAGYTAARERHPNLFRTYEEALAHDPTL